MTGTQLAKYRKEKKRTQAQTARALGVSQTYLSLLESGKRPLTESIQRKGVRFFELLPTELPPVFASGRHGRVSDNQIAADLADLGYPGFSHLRRKRLRLSNPADVLFNTLNASHREARILEGLPWLVYAYPDMNWSELLKSIKAHDLQNRLGFVVSVAAQLADKVGDVKKAAKIREVEQSLERSILAHEDTLCHEDMTNAERRWLIENRPVNAKKWRILSDLKLEHLDHYE